MYIKVKDAYIYILTILVTHISFISISSAFVGGYDSLVWKTSRLCLLLMIPEFGIFVKSRYLRMNILVGVLCISIFMSAMLNKGILTFSIISSLQLITKLLCFVLFFEIISFEGYWDKSIKLMIGIIVCYCAMSDILMFVAPHRTWSAWGEHYDTFLVGSKFNMSYLHLWLVILFPLVYKDKKTTHFMLMLWTFVISVLDECSTMVVGMIVFYLLFYFHDRIKRVIYNKIFLIFALVFFAGILILGSEILQLPVVQRILLDVLNETPTLSGRMNIYTRLETLLLVNPFVGVSFDSNYNFSYIATGAANYQNGIIDLYVSFGFIGITLFIILLIGCCHYCEKMDDRVLVSSVYLFIVISAVEIVYRMNIYMILFLGFICFKHSYGSSAISKGELI